MTAEGLGNWQFDVLITLTNSECFLRLLHSRKNFLETSRKGV